MLLIAILFFVEGDQILREGVAERGQGAGARRLGQGRWANEGGVRGAMGWNLYFNKLFNKTA